MVKVAHHGSLDSHRGSTVCRCHKTQGECVAAISTGDFDVLPDREVLQDFLDNDWTVILTTKRDFADYPLGAIEMTALTGKVVFMRSIKGSLVGLVLAGILALAATAAFAHGEGELPAFHAEKIDNRDFAIDTCYPTHGIVGPETRKADYTAAESRAHPHPTDSQRVSKNRLTSPA